MENGKFCIREGLALGVGAGLQANRINVSKYKGEAKLGFGLKVFLLDDRITLTIQGRAMNSKRG